MVEIQTEAKSIGRVMEVYYRIQAFSELEQRWHNYFDKYQEFDNAYHWMKRMEEKYPDENWRVTKFTEQVIRKMNS